jgi:hypothetical protein
MPSHSPHASCLPPSEPPDGERPRCLRLVVGGAQPRGGWHLSAIACIQGFSSSCPAASSHQWSVWWGEASRATASALPSASRIFIILAGEEGEASRGPTPAGAGDPLLPSVIGGEGRSPALRRGRPSTTLGRSAASVVSSSMPGFAGSAGSSAASGATSHRWAECGYLPVVRAAVAPRAPGGRPRRRTLLGRRSCSWVVLPSLWHDA